MELGSNLAQFSFALVWTWFLCGCLELWRERKYNLFPLILFPSPSTATTLTRAQRQFKLSMTGRLENVKWRYRHVSGLSALATRDLAGQVLRGLHRNRALCRRMAVHLEKAHPLPIPLEIPTLEAPINKPFTNPRISN